MSKIAAAVLSFACVAVFAMPMSAQLIPHGNAYIGAAYSRSDIIVNRYGFKGWNGSGEFIPFVRQSYFGVVLDASGFYRPGISLYNFLIGPRISYQYGKWRPFGQAMGGVQRLISDSITYHPVAYDIGGGVDYKLPFRNFSWRVQGDYVHSRELSASQNQVRASTGLVWRF